MTTGKDNVFIGCAAGTSAGIGDNWTTGSCNIAIGHASTVCGVMKVAWSTSSDCRDKTDIQDLTAGLDFIKALRPVTYRWDDRHNYWERDENDQIIKYDDDGNLITPVRDGSHKQEKLRVGLISQEVLPAEKEAGYHTIEDVDSLFVSGTFDGGYRMDYERLVAPLINAVKELDAENTALKARVTTLEGG